MFHILYVLALNLTVVICFNPKTTENTWVYIHSTVATNALVLKHQVISIHVADQIVIASDQLQRKNIANRKISIWKKNYMVV